MQLRDYQANAVNSVFDQWQEHRSALGVCATGGGKTIIFSKVIERALSERGGRAMVIAHREELIWQAAQKIKAATGLQCEIEMADYRADTGIFGKSPVVISTVQTLNAGMGGNGRMTRFDPDEFSVLIQDECHHAVSSTWRKVNDYFAQNDQLRVLGLTATPDRADESALGQVFDAVAFNYDIMELIGAGWLVPIEQNMVTVDSLDLSAVRTTAGDLNGADLAEVMEFERTLHEIASPTISIAAGRKTVVFAASVSHAERLCEIFNRYKQDSARWVCGATPKDVRRRMFQDYADGRFQFLVNVDVLTEGWDDPGVEVVVMARPTKSRAKYAQCIGRGTRALPGVVDRYEEADDRRMAIAESAKPCVEVIDFVGNAGKHKLICTADLLGGDYDDEVVDRARGKARESERPTDTARLLEEAKQEIHEERERERQAEARRRARLTARAKYTAQRVDPFDVFAIEPARERGWDAGRSLSEKQKGLLEKQGISTEGMSYTHAQQLIKEMFARWDNGKASFKQAKLLKKYGLPGDVSRDQAKEWIDQIASNNWRLPPDLSGQKQAVEMEIF